MILNGWKQIAGYTKSSVRTVQRWEKAGMPVIRPLPGSRGSVITYSGQLDSWLVRHSRVETASSQSQRAITATRHDFHETLVRTRELNQQIRRTKMEMGARMSLLQTQVSLLKETLIRMNLVGNRSARLPLPVTPVRESNCSDGLSGLHLLRRPN